MPLIELQNLCKDYFSAAGILPVLKHLNLSVEKGEFIALMGHSGSGKSTLMNILGCLDVPTEGHYLLDGHDVKLMDADQQARLRNHMIGFVFQGFNLLPRATLLNNVALPMVYARTSKPIREKRAQELLGQVGLGHRLFAMPNEISGGEQQRVAIARALANKTQLILADEPTGNLDTSNSHAVMQLFTELNREGITIFLVTHEPDVAAYARRLIQLRDGILIHNKKTNGRHL